MGTLQKGRSLSIVVVIATFEGLGDAKATGVLETESVRCFVACSRKVQLLVLPNSALPAV
jgi:hypothetical protein